jgi:hypothetical protein|eukprot:evm.model.NODE_11720_length_31253_cov_26.129396.1
MGKLNEHILGIVATSNTCFTVSGLFLGGLASYLLYATAPATFTLGSLFKGGWIVWTLLVGLGLILSSCISCVALKRQMVRVGPCGGRKLLSMYQLLVMGLMVAFTIGLLTMRTMQSAVPLLLEQPNTPYARSEQKMLAPYFDRVYFKTKAVVERDYSEQGGSYKWFLAWTRQNCPLSMDMGSCTTCSSNGDSTIPYNDGCCPRQDLCTAGNLEACPYMRCRLGVATFLNRRLGRMQNYMYIFLALLLLVILSTCLLICYNPRDSFEDLLAKTGVVVMHERRAPASNSQQRRSGRSGMPGAQECEQSSSSSSSSAQCRGRAPSAAGVAVVRASPISISSVADVEGGRGGTRYGGSGGAGGRSPVHIV